MTVATDSSGSEKSDPMSGIKVIDNVDQQPHFLTQVMSDQLLVVLGLGLMFRINSTLLAPTSSGQGGSQGELS